MFNNLVSSIYRKTAKIACKIAPYSLGPIFAKIEYRRLMGRRLNLKHPSNLVEKIVWMQFHTDTSLWTKCADKYRVREYVKSKGLGAILPKIYGSWEDIEKIDFKQLPNSFVLKTNNSCGQNLIIRDKAELDESSSKQKLSKWLTLSYGHHNGQLHYTRIKPCIIAEELLVDQSLKSDENLVDYKIWCFNGIPESILVIKGRKGSDYQMVFYDAQWNNISYKSLKKTTTHYTTTEISKPKNFELMLEYAKVLSADFPEVRVDLYNINGKIYFGELTFTSGYGNYSDEYYEYLGSKIDLSKLNKIR